MMIQSKKIVTIAACLPHSTVFLDMLRQGRALFASVLIIAHYDCSNKMDGLQIDLLKFGEKTMRSSASWMKRRFSPLTFNVVTDRLLTCIADGTAKIPITPKGPFFPIVPFQFRFVPPPKPKRRFLFQFAYNGKRRNPRFALDQAVNVILIHFHLFVGKIRRGSHFLEKCSCHTSIHV
jgi:hypothetical protein